MQIFHGMIDAATFRHAQDGKVVLKKKKTGIRLGPASDLLPIRDHPHYTHTYVHIYIYIHIHTYIHIHE